MTQERNDLVILRPVWDADLPILFEQQLDPEANQMAAFTARDPSDRAAFEARWKKIRADESVLIRAILFDGEVAGSILSHSGFGELEVSYWIGRAYWGRGVATAALTAFLREQTTRPIFGRAAKDNLGSIRVLEKCGFVLEKEERGFANARGAEIDEVVMKWVEG